jgi:hypothetical protein
VRRVLERRLLLLAALGLAGCGDDGKVGTTAPETGTSDGTDTTSPSIATPAPVEVRAGDVATWEVRVAGRAEVTTVTWRASRGADGGVQTTVESRTAEPSGRLLSETSAATAFAAGGPTAGDVVREARETVDVGSRSLETTRTTLRLPGGEATVWRSSEVPFGGLVRARTPGGVEQTLVSFRRGPPGRR